jgi:hypothetical protein
MVERENRRPAPDEEIKDLEEKKRHVPDDRSSENKVRFRLSLGPRVSSYPRSHQRKSYNRAVET